MTHSEQHDHALLEEDVALLAGGDLESTEIPRVTAHLEGCGACRGLLAELEGDRALFAAAAAAQTAASDQAVALTASVLSGGESGGESTGRFKSAPGTADDVVMSPPAARERSPSTPFPAWASAAAVALVLGASALLGQQAGQVGREEAGDTGEANAVLVEATETPAALVRLRDVGGQVELTWQHAALGRNGAPSRVLASTTPDFSRPQLTEVLGDRLVVERAGVGDRTLTYYKVQ